MKNENYSKYLRHRVKILASNNEIYRGYIVNIDSPQDSEDNQYWLDVVHVDNPIIKKGAEMTIAESEIKEITIIDK